MKRTSTGQTLRAGIAAILIASSLSAMAQDSCSEVAGQATTIYFGNGIKTSLAAANVSAANISQAWRNELASRFPDESYAFQAAYNDTFGLTADIQEVFLQKLGESGFDVGSAFGFFLFQTINAGGRFTEAVLAAAPLGFDDPSEALFEAAVAAHADTMAESLMGQDGVLQEHIQKYEGDLLAGRRVLVIAHSQGNLFANNAVEAVIARNPSSSDSIAIVGVASPASRTIADFDYFTAEDDRVIQALSLITNVLAANVDNDPGILGDARSATNHYFDRDYFNASLVSRDLIEADAFERLANMPFPVATVSEGALRATLTWGTEPDVDLHVFEPDGTQVFYQNLTGSFGELDRDDTTSFGPENYFVPCDTAIDGVYQIGVNYFRGSAPETASVQLSLGDGTTTTRSRVLTTAEGAAGNANPEIVFEVEIVTEDDGRISYTIQ